MNKVTAAIAAGLVGLIGVIFARAEGLVSEALVADVVVGGLLVALAILLSWAVTAVMGSNHSIWARVTAGTLCLAGGWQRWHDISVGWLSITLLVALMSPLLFMGFEALLLRFGIVLRKGAQGETIGVKVGDDRTVMLGARPQDMVDTVVSDGPTTPSPDA